MATFLEMPDIAFEHVSNQLNVKDILKLGKTCKSIRSYLDIEKPDFRIEFLNIKVKTDEASFSIETTNEESFVSTYKMIDDNTTSVSEKQKRIVNSNYMKVILDDMEILLNNQKPSHQSFEISIIFEDEEKFRSNEEIKNQRIEAFLTSLKEILASRNPLIRIASLYMEVMDQKQIMLILPHVSPKALQQIYIESATDEFRRLEYRPFEMNAIMETEHWRNLRVFNTEKFIITASVCDLAHIIDLSTKIRTVTIDDLVILKQALITSTTTSSYYQFKYDTFEEKDRLVEVFGPPTEVRHPQITEMDGATTRWLFDTPREGQKIMFVLWNDNKQIDVDWIDVERLGVE